MGDSLPNMDVMKLGKLAAYQARMESCRIRSLLAWRMSDETAKDLTGFSDTLTELHGLTVFIDNNCERGCVSAVHAVTGPGSDDGR